MTPEGFDVAALTAGFVLVLLSTFAVGVLVVGWTVLLSIVES